jgi:adenosylcobinamide kinase/adenosylcobinamide-phosphate guanylyltransferase
MSTNLPQATLVLGGARSGKSQYAEDLVEGADASGGLIYVATAQAYDNEMHERIAIHQRRRGDRWSTIDAPLDLNMALKSDACCSRAVLVDCLTLWITNLMMAGKNVSREIDELCVTIPTLTARVVFVSNEVGQGIVPDNEMAREFRDHAGQAHQQLAAICNRVVFVTAGLPQILKDDS